MGSERSWKLERELLGGPVVYPGHPLVIAFLITHVFESLADATFVDPTQTCAYSAALTSSAIPGGGGEVYQALDLLRLIQKGVTPTDAVAYIRERWNGGGHAKAIEPGQQQADQITEAFIERVQEWIKK